jgi:hypothetical protein
VQESSPLAFFVRQQHECRLMASYDNLSSNRMAEQRQTGGVTLWDLLTLISFVVPVAGAAADAKHSHAGLVGYVLAISVGLAIGVCCAVCMRIALVRVGGYLVRGDVSARAVSWYSGLMLIAAFIWMVFGLFAESWIVTKIVRFLFMSV